MTIIILPNKSVDLRDDLLKLKGQSNRATILKSLLFTAALAAGVAAIIFLGSSFLAYGIAAVVISTFAIYKCVKHYQLTNNIFNRAADAVTHRIHN